MTLQKAIIATLTYHDIFAYPLKIEEIQNYLIEKKSSLKSINKAIEVLKAKKIIDFHLNYIFLKKRLSLGYLRKKREKYSKNKLKKALLYTKILHYLPTIKCICATGALSMNNCTQNDDIDLLIICQKNTIWTTRLLANILLLPFKRSPKNKDISNKACLNIFLDESDLMIKVQNLYTAHEICQMKILWDIKNTYYKFIKKNNWFQKYLPNWRPESGGVVKNKQLEVPIPKIIEKTLKHLQIFYMKSKITTETIGDTQLFFHPKNTQSAILKKFHQNSSKY
jgi:hypothetical protein